jgi:hypothetical protein
MSREFCIRNHGKACILLFSSTSAQRSRARTQGADAGVDPAGDGLGGGAWPADELHWARVDLLATPTGLFAAAQLDRDRGTAARMAGNAVAAAQAAPAPHSRWGCWPPAHVIGARSGPSTHPIQRPRIASDVATLTASLLLRKSY